MIINFNRFSGNIFTLNGNLTIVNGQTINIKGAGVSQSFDEVKSKSADGIEKITIESPFSDVNILISNSPKIEAHFYGNAEIDGNVDFKVCIVDRELKISLKLNGNCYNGNLKLDVAIPRKAFKEIAIQSMSANIALNEGVSARHVKINTQSGNLKSEATFSNISVRTMSGKVELLVNAETDIFVKASSMSGNMTAKFNNIGNIVLSAKSMSGSISNYHGGKIGYMANVNVSTMSGDITII